ncbi:MAG: hypothetical protein UR26_C0004G0020 [candidate division TM6 bacterium GW2011_GWF2_32_72]|nr:MAG: hypothetical protein UR26_C0004G0020 [candidate division TM6 bacterium GW2011_GWF2_32_72]
MKKISLFFMAMFFVFAPIESQSTYSTNQSMADAYVFKAMMFTMLACGSAGLAAKAIEHCVLKDEVQKAKFKYASDRLLEACKEFFEACLECSDYVQVERNKKSSSSSYYSGSQKTGKQSSSAGNEQKKSNFKEDSKKSNKQWSSSKNESKQSSSQQSSSDNSKKSEYKKSSSNAKGSSKSSENSGYKPNFTKTENNKVDLAYKTLGLSNGTAVSDVKKAYKKFALKYHPDKNKSADATQKMQQINEAYETLKSVLKFE